MISGQYQRAPRLLDGGEASLQQLLGLWLAETGRDRGAWPVYAAKWREHFSNLAELCRASSIKAYWEARLKVVQWDSLKKERGPLRDFLAWCVEAECLSEVPEIPPLPSKRLKPGTLAKNGRAKTVEVTADEARAIVAHLPEHSSGKRTERFPIRSRFELMLELGLRNGTLDRLSVPEHYRPGTRELRITADIDKNSYERVLDLPEHVGELLDSVAPKKGLIFGTHDYRPFLKAAARKALDEHRAARFSAYSFRHRAATELASFDLMGASHTLGHKQPTTINRYAHPERDASHRALTRRAQRYSRVVPPGSPQNPDAQTKKPALRRVSSEVLSCAKKRTRTSTGVTPLAPQGNSEHLNTADSDYLESIGGHPDAPKIIQSRVVPEAEQLRVEAIRMLRLAALREEIPRADAEAFATSVLTTTQVGRLVLQVLDGGPHAIRALVELAALVSSDTEADDTRSDEEEADHG